MLFWPIRIAALAAAFFVASVFTDATDGFAQSKTKWPECFCTDKQGQRRELGDVICLTVGGRSFRAKCVMAQNNPFWRDLNEGCLSSQAPQDATPFNKQIAALYQLDKSSH